MKKFLSLLLLCSVILSVLPILSIPVGAASQGVNVLSGLKGESNDPSYESPSEWIGMAYLTDGLKLCNEGTKSSVWQSSYLSSQDVNVYIDFDLGGTYLVSSAALYPRGQDGKFFPEEYDIQVSDDGKEWRTVKSVTGDTSTAIEGREVTFGETEARFVRVLIKKHYAMPASKGYTTQISELEVIASKTVISEEEITDTMKNLQDQIDAIDQAMADLEQAIADGDKALDDKITALNTALTNAKAALEKADTDNKAALEKAIADGDEALQAAIDKVAEDLVAAQEALNKAIADGDKALDDKITALNTALTNAKAALEKADTDNKAALEKAIADGDKALQAAIDKVYDRARFFLSSHSGFYAILGGGMLLAQCAIWRGDMAL